MSIIRSCARRGFSLVEVILANSILILLVTTLVGAWLYGQESTVLAGNRVQAAFFAEEGLEAVRNIRDANFTYVSNGTFGLTVSGSEWILSGSLDTNGIFTREIEISSLDSDRKEIVSTVTWQQNAQRVGSVSVISRLSNWLQVIDLIGDWSNAIVTSTLNLSGNEDGLKIAVSGDYVFLIRSASNPDFIVVDVSNPAAPVQVASLNLAGTLANIAVSGNFAYVTSNDNNAELLIVNISNPIAPSLAGTYNAPNNTDGSGVFVSSTVVYMGRVDNGATNEFLIVNASNPASPALTGSLNLSGNANEISVLGNYAYIASSNNSQELQVVNITNPSVPTLAGSLNLSGNTDALTIAAYGSTVVIGQGSILYLVNVATPASPSVLGSISAGGTVNDTNLGNSNTYAFVGSSNNSAEFQVINITTSSAPSTLESLNLSGNSGLLGIAYDSVNDRAYAVSNANTQEFFIFLPQ